MKRTLPWSLVVVLSVALVYSHRDSLWGTIRADEPKDKESVFEQGYAAYEFDDLVNQREKGHAWFPFLRVPALYCGVYGLKAGAKDGQSPHREDEVYYVVKGTGKFEAGEGEQKAVMPYKPGTVLYVKAGVAHRFAEIDEDTELLVFFSTAKPASKE